MLTFIYVRFSATSVVAVVVVSFATGFTLSEISLSLSSLAAFSSRVSAYVNSSVGDTYWAHR